LLGQEGQAGRRRYVRKRRSHWWWLKCAALLGAYDEAEPLPEPQGAVGPSGPPMEAMDSPAGPPPSHDWELTMACYTQSAPCDAHSFTTTLRLGYHSASTTTSREGAHGMSIALHKILEEGGHASASYRFVTTSDSDAICKALELMNHECVHAVIGGGMSSTSAIAQSTFALAKIPQVAYSSSSVTLSNRDKYPTFSRVVPVDDEQSKALVAICKEFGWSYVAVVSTQEVYGQGLADSFRVAFSRNGGSVVLNRSFESFTSRLRGASINESVEAIVRSRARIVALFVDSADSARDFLQTASEYGLMATYLACDSWIDKPVKGPHFNLNYVGVVPTTPRQGAAYNTFKSHWKTAPPVDHPDACVDECRERPPTPEGMIAYDTTLLVYRAWNLSLEKGEMPHNLSNGAFLHSIRSVGLPNGLTSSILLNEDGELVNGTYDTINFSKKPIFCGAEGDIPLDGSQPSSVTSRVIEGPWQKVDAGKNTTAAIDLRNLFNDPSLSDDCRQVVVNVLSNDEPSTVLSNFSDGFLSEPSKTTDQEHCAIVLTAPLQAGEYFLQIYVNNIPAPSRELSTTMTVNESNQAITIILPITLSSCVLFICFLWSLRRWRNSSPVAASDDRDMLALFCNPRITEQEKQQYGLNPLALGQELKHLLRLVPLHLLAIEPAATLLDAQNACEQYHPRILSFSGHTLAGKLAFEDDNGRLDTNDAEKIVKLITGNLATEDKPKPRRSASGPSRNRGDADFDDGVCGVCASPEESLREESSSISAQTKMPQPATSADDSQIGLNGPGNHCAHLATGTKQRTLPVPSPPPMSNKPRLPPLPDHSAVPHVACMPSASNERSSTCDVAKTPPPRRTLLRLECVILSGCKTEEIARKLLAAAPSLTIICWKTLVEDSAARSFTRGVYSSLGRQLQRKNKPTLLQQLLRHKDDKFFGSILEHAFHAGCRTFADDNFKIGNPEDFLHLPSHEHKRAPRYDTCEGCSPPVHGEPLLLKYENGEVSCISPRA
ncbi:MAG: hypothetical protein SGPRY_008154, partial [Prymnesium sp.]